ncbi:hypothetical protein SLEP1_g35771 [Rubroshorea leprosula]|uniref:Epidermal patterning factor-like protein n=1 Tax=Rubroshorea leprosula TaxID=152421 RepID=A0AAV5KP97_9ROSI|nr:hypothetical protein SLEP1_g35771 [Rubroshorea leprosula]
MKGSLPVACHAKCNQCKPCIPIEVSIQAMEVQENEYYPLVWKCICQKTIFSPKSRAGGFFIQGLDLFSKGMRK